MKTVKHPTIPGITRTVTNKELTRWQKAGWVDTTPAPAASKRTEAPKTGASPVPSRSRTAARKKG